MRVLKCFMAGKPGLRKYVGQRR